MPTFDPQEAEDDKEVSEAEGGGEHSAAMLSWNKMREKEQASQAAEAGKCGILLAAQSQLVYRAHFLSVVLISSIGCFW